MQLTPMRPKFEDYMVLDPLQGSETVVDGGQDVGRASSWHGQRNSLHGRRAQDRRTCGRVAVIVVPVVSNAVH